MDEPARSGQVTQRGREDGPNDSWARGPLRHGEIAVWRAGAFHGRVDDLGGVLDLGLGASNNSSSWTRNSMRVFSPAGASPTGMRLIARLMSAAEPCKGALIACRSAPARRAGSASGIPGMKHFRPKIVST